MNILLIDWIGGEIYWKEFKFDLSEGVVLGILDSLEKLLLNILISFDMFMGFWWDGFVFGSLFFLVFKCLLLIVWLL